MATIDSKFTRTGFRFCFALAVGAAVAGCAKPPGAGDYLAAKDRIISAFKTESARCAQLSGNAYDVCVQRAEGDQSVALAELAFQYSGKPEDRARVALAKNDASYAVAKAMCDEQSGAPRDTCLADADTARIKADEAARLADR
jgi:hypothetical protein